MKKGILMIAALAMLSMSATACKASEKADDDTDDTEVRGADTATKGELKAEALEALDAVAEAESGVDVPDAAAGAEVQGSMDPKDYQTTPSGLRYHVLREGTGKQPASPNALVKVHYAGKHLDGTTFDSSYDRGEPIEFPLNRVIPGWTEGVQLMKEGAKYEFLIPSQLAYGQMGTPGGPIKPNEDLYFVVELLEVK